MKHDTDSEVEDLAPLFDGDRQSVKTETHTFWNSVSGLFRYGVFTHLIDVCKVAQMKLPEVGSEDRYRARATLDNLDFDYSLKVLGQRAVRS